MARKLPKLEHVKYVRAKGKLYAYFNTGRKNSAGHPIRVRLPDPAAIDFHDKYAAFKAARTRRKNAVYTVADLAEEYLASASFIKRPESTKKNYRTHLTKVTEEWGRFPAGDLQSADVRLVIESDRWTPGTAYMVLAVIGVIYKWGRRNRGLEIDPTRDVERPKYGEHDPWPSDVLEAALTSEDDLVRLSSHLLYFSGQRIGDVLAMRWGDIRDGSIYVKQGKTGKVVEPPLTAELAEELARTPRKGIYILDGVKPAYLRRRLQAFTSALGVKTVPHGLRKNAVNALLEAGCTVPEAAAITGQTHQVVEHYAARVNRRMLGKAAVVKLDLQRGGTKKQQANGREN